jgi:hypothetical protein
MPLTPDTPAWLSVKNELEGKEHTKFCEVKNTTFLVEGIILFPIKEY